MRIAFATDTVDECSSAVLDALAHLGHVVTDVAPGAEWPTVGRRVGESVVTGDADYGVVCCWTGTGVSIAANKVPGVRAALCDDPETAAGARRWNDANVLALGLTRLTAERIPAVVRAFLETKSDPTERDTIATVEPDRAPTIRTGSLS